MTFSYGVGMLLYSSVSVEVKTVPSIFFYPFALEKISIAIAVFLWGTVIPFLPFLDHLITQLCLKETGQFDALLCQN